MKKYAWITIWFIAAIQPALGQHYDYRVGLEQPEQSAYHRILLTPEVVAHTSDHQMGDLRLKDQHNEDVAYFISQEQRFSYSTHYKTYPLLDVEYNDNWQYDARLVIHNNRKAPIDRLTLKMANFEDQRTARLTGSYDQKTWFIVKDGFVFHNITNTEEAYMFHVMRFPLVDYPYLRIEIDDNNWHRRHWDRFHEEYIQIVEAGYFDKYRVQGEFSEVDGITFHQMDTAADHSSEIYLQTQGRPMIDNMVFDIDQDDHYHRHADLYQKTSLTDTTYRWDYVTSFWISSTGLNAINLKGKRLSSALKVVIHNKSDRPLPVKKIQIHQLKRYMTAKLEKGNSYTLAFGNDSVKAPEYDIVYFKDQIGGTLSVIQPRGELVYIPKSEAEVPLEKEKTDFDEHLIIWLVITAVGLLFGYMSIRMMNDVKSKSHSESDPSNPIT